MNLLINSTGNNTDAELFSVVENIEYYDGCTIALAELAGTTDWYLCFLSALDQETYMRIHTVIKPDPGEVQLLREELDGYNLLSLSGQETAHDKIISQVRDVIRDYKGDVFLLKTRFFNAVPYSIRKVEMTELSLYEDLGDIWVGGKQLYEKFNKNFQ